MQSEYNDKMISLNNKWHSKSFDEKFDKIIVSFNKKRKKKVGINFWYRKKH